MARESKFQSDLIDDLEEMFPGSIVFKNDSYIQGFPDVTILYEDMWAILECKKSANEPHQPNQDYYVELLDQMSFSRFIYPENKEKVLNDLQKTFAHRSAARFSRRK